MRNEKELTGYPSIDRMHEFGYSYFEKNPIIFDTTIFNLSNLMNILNGNKKAIQCLDREITYKELKTIVSKLSKSLKEIGVKAGDIVPISAPSIIQGVILYFALNNIGATTTFLNAKASDEEIKFYLNEFESPVYINYNKSKEDSKKEIEGTKVKVVITLGEEDIFNKPLEVDSNIVEYGYSNILSFNDLLYASKYYNNFIKTNFGKDQDSLILYTSGTSGNPKPVVLTNGNIIASALYMKNTTGISFGKGETSMCVVPFNYPYGFVTSALMTLLCGKDLILSPTLNLSNISEYLKKYNPAIIQAVPSFYNFMRKDAVVNKMDLSFLKLAISGGDFLSEAEITENERFFREHGSDAKLCNGSGAAEVSGCGTSSVGVDCPLHSVGKLLVGSNMKVIDPTTKEELKYNQEGLLCYSGEHVFNRYFNHEEDTKTAKVNIDGTTWYVSDTIGRIDEKGNVFILDRLRRFFITYDETGQAYKIYPNYVQSVIDTIDEIESCAVVKKEHELRSFVGKVYIVLKEGIEPSEELKLFLGEKIRNTSLEQGSKLKSYEIPVEIEFIDELPIAESGKVDYKSLEEKTINSSTLTLK